MNPRLPSTLLRLRRSGRTLPLRHRLISAVAILPLLRKCTQFSGAPEAVCAGYPYLGHGNPLGYLILTIALLTGPAMLASTRLHAGPARLVVCLAAAVNLFMTVLTGWGIGFFLLPGTLLLLVGAGYRLFSRRPPACPA